MVTWAYGWQFPPEFQEHVHDVVIDVAHEPFGEIEHEHDYHSAHILLYYQPTYFHEDPYWRDMINAAGKELDVLHATLDQLLSASFPQFSPEWALRRWEELTGNPVAPPDVSVADRRAAVLSKLVKGPVTVTDFKQLIDRFFGVDGDIIERPNLYEVEFNVYGNPTNAERRAFERILRAYVPAHLTISVNYGGFIVGVNTVGDEV